MSEVERSADLTSFHRNVAEQSGRTVGVHRDDEANNAQEIPQRLGKTGAFLELLRITRSFSLREDVRINNGLWRLAMSLVPA